MLGFLLPYQYRKEKDKKKEKDKHGKYSSVTKCESSEIKYWSNKIFFLCWIQTLADKWIECVIWILHAWNQDKGEKKNASSCGQEITHVFGVYAMFIPIYT